MTHHYISSSEYWTTHNRLAPLVRHGEELGTRATFHVIGDDDGTNDPPAAAILKFKPGQVIVRHAHDCFRFEVILDGSMEADGETLRRGDIMTARPMEPYGPYIVGPEGCTTVEIFSTVSAAHQVHYPRLDGTTARVDYLAGDERPADLAGLEGVADRVKAMLAQAAG